MFVGKVFSLHVFCAVLVLVCLFLGTTIVYGSDQLASQDTARLAADCAATEFFNSDALYQVTTYYLPDGSPRVYAFVYENSDSYSTVLASATRDDVPVIMAWKGLPKHQTSFQKARDKITEELNHDPGTLTRVIWLEIFDVWLEFSEMHPQTGSPICYDIYDDRVTDLQTVHELWSRRQATAYASSLSGSLCVDSNEAQQIMDERNNYRQSCWADIDRLAVTGEAASSERPGIAPLSDPQPNTKYIENVPNIDQAGFQDCGIVSTLDVLLYWDTRGYSQLVDYQNIGDARFNLQEAMKFDWLTGVVCDDIISGTDEFCNDSEYGNNYSFDIPIFPSAWWPYYTQSLDQGRPAVMAVTGYTDDPCNPTDKEYEGHAMCGVGYYEGQLFYSTSTRWAIVHDNHGGGTYDNPYIIDDEPYIDWYRATHCLMEVIPGGTTNYADLHDGGEQYSMFLPDIIARDDQNIAIICDIENAQNAGDAGPYRVAFYASVDTSITSDDHLIGEKQMSWLDAGNYANCDFSIAFPESIPDGEYYVGWIIDPCGHVPESNTSNNTAYEAAYKLTVNIDDHYEENDSFSYAYDLTEHPTVPLYSISGYATQKDDDWYKIEVAETCEHVRVYCYFAHAEGDIDISLHQSDGTLVDYSNSVTDDEYIDSAVPSDGTYYIRAYYGDAGNTYTLTWESICMTDDTYEENDTRAEAAILRMSDIWITCIQNDEDWYLISIGPGEEKVRIDCRFTQDGVPENDINIALCDASGSYLASSDSTTDNEYIEYCVPTDGVYYIKVFGGDSGNIYDLWWSTSQCCGPAAPSLTAQTGYSTGQIVLTWPSVTGADGYKIFYDTDYDCPPFDPDWDGSPASGSDVGNVTHVVVNNLDPGRDYYCAVKAYDSCDESFYSGIEYAVAAAPLLPQLVFEDSQIDDDMSGNSRGNNDGFINPGETVELSIAIRNNADGPAAHNVTAHLSTADPHVTSFLIADADYGDIPSANSRWATYCLTISPLCPDAHLIDLDLDPISATEGTWSDSLFLMIDAGGIIPQQVPYTQFFDSSLPGSPDGWEYQRSSTDSRIQITHSQLRMDADTFPDPNALNANNEAILHLNLNGFNDVMLWVLQSESSDDRHYLPTTYVGQAFGDGLSVSNDGMHWYEIADADALAVGPAGKAFRFDLNQVGIPYSSDFQVKFQQYDNGPWPNDGRAFDDIYVTAIDCDLDNDGDVDLSDFAFLADYWLDTNCSSGNMWCIGADIDIHGSVSVDDLSLLAERWLQGN